MTDEPDPRKWSLDNSTQPPVRHTATGTEVTVEDFLRAAAQLSAIDEGRDVYFFVAPDGHTFCARRSNGYRVDMPMERFLKLIGEPQEAAKWKIYGCADVFGEEGG